MDRDNASFERTMSSLEEAFGRSPIPIQLPIGEEKDFTGVVNILTNKAYQYSRDGSGKAQEIPVPAALQEEANRTREKLIEMVAESSDALMEKFFADGTLEPAEILEGLKASVFQRSIVPVLCASATLNIGAAQVLDAIVDLLP